MLKVKIVVLLGAGATETGQKGTSSTVLLLDLGADYTGVLGFENI